MMFSMVRLLLLLIISSSGSVGASPLTLSNPNWTVELEPATLAVHITPQGAAPQVASRGGPKRRVSQLRSDASTAQWSWNEGAWQVQVELRGADLMMTITAREPGSLLLIDQPASVFGKGLLLPMAEGRYVAAGDAVWREFLLQEMGRFDTQQDLSLPLVGMDYGDHTLHWLFLEPFGNQLHWRAEGERLSLQAHHAFSPLAMDTPMRWLLHLGGPDLLAGAKRYRQWLLATDTFEPMADKIAANPGTLKLLGATHVYLWGGGLLAPKDVVDWMLLQQHLAGDGTLAAALAKQREPEAQHVLDTAGIPNRYQRRVLIRDLNRALNAMAREAWQTAAPDPERMVAAYRRVRDTVATELGDALTPNPSEWGGGVSRQTMQRLRGSGLGKLWIGLGDSWEPGLWHPEAIADGVQAGWLVAPYDSYETALPLGENPDWSTAHLGEDAYLRCAIMREAGERKAGFLGKGHYTDPSCVRPLLERRVQAVQGTTGFNSWFLDAYATGMLYESYRPGATMTFAANAEGNIDASRWIGLTLPAVVGSEDGNAVTAQGIAFAHGLQTPVMGWDDPDIGHQANRNTRSPYYLGNYFPAEQPSVFFKQVPAKPLYQHVHFAAPSRLPLYQAVFHDALVTSHHWGMDNLKFSNVQPEGTLMQLLYNVAPMFHLSADTLDERLPAMQRIDVFFRPLHERLATQALIAFHWRTPDRMVQETHFADGTVLQANFSESSRRIDGSALAPYTVRAISPHGLQSNYSYSPVR